MNKDEIIRRLKALPYDPEEYWLLNKAAKVLHGQYWGTADIYLGCTKELANRLEAEGYMTSGDPSKKIMRFFQVDKDLFVHEGLFSDITERIDGFRVLTQEGLELLDWRQMSHWGLNPDKMKETCSGHFVYHYPEGSLAEKEMEKIQESREKSYRMVCDTLQTEPDFPIHYYLVNSPEEAMPVLCKDGLAFTKVYYPDLSFSVYNERMRAVGFEELTRIVTAVIGDPESHAVQDYIPHLFYPPWGGADALTWTVFFRKTGRLMKMEDLLDNDNYSERNGYITDMVLAAFAKWLLKAFGLDPLKVLVGCTDSREGFRKAYGMEITEIDQLFLSFVRRFDIDDEALKGLEGVIQKVLVQGRKQ